MTARRDYNLSGIGCANCARKIEAAVSKLEGVKEANLNFTLLKLTVLSTEELPQKQLGEKIQSIMNKIEPGSRLYTDEQINSSDNQNKWHEHIDKDGHKGCKDHQEEGRHTHEHNHEHGHEHSSGGLPVWGILLYAFGVIAYFTGFFLIQDPTIKLILFIFTYAIFGFKVLKKSFFNILRGQIFDENFLMAIASIGAFIIGEFPEGAAVMMFYQIGELFQDYALDHSRKSIKSLLNIKPEYANIKTSNGEQRISPSEVEVGQLIVIRPGERVPLDGIVISGISALDTSALTGESMPREVQAGSEILSGSINLSGVLEVKVTKAFGQSTVSRILSLVEDASQKKAVTERFITRFAAWYTPVVVFLAMLLAFIPPLLFNEEMGKWVYRGLLFLVISCPCALVISIPLGFFGGIGAASKRGILVKGGNYLEALAKVETVVFDKTGTLTKGAFEVTAAEPMNGFSRDELLYYMSHAEAYSSHPLALSVTKAYGSEPEKGIISVYREYAGKGISATISGKSVLCGNAKLLESFGLSTERVNEIGTLIHLAVDNEYKGWVKLEDTVKNDAGKAVSDLRELGVNDIIMLTGDQRMAAEKIAQGLGIKKVYSELLPHEKVGHMEAIMNEYRGKKTVAFVGDGINDAPVIARADIGVAMGGAGSDAAIEAADIVMMTDEPGKLTEAIQIARKTRAVVFQNIALAVAVKVLVLALGAGGVATLWEAVFADVGVALLAIMNAMRLIKNANRS